MIVLIRCYYSLIVLIPRYHTLSHSQVVVFNPMLLLSDCVNPTLLLSEPFTGDCVNPMLLLSEPFTGDCVNPMLLFSEPFEG